MLESNYETKCQSMEWRIKLSSRPRKFRLQIAYTYINWVRSTKSLCLNKKPRRSYSVWERAQEMLLKRISSVRPQFWKKSTSFLLHDNEPAHSDASAALPAEPGHGDRPSTWSREPTFSYSLKCKLPLKDSFRSRVYQEKCHHQFKRNSIGRLPWLFCTNFKRIWIVCCSKGRLL